MRAQSAGRTGFRESEREDLQRAVKRISCASVMCRVCLKQRGNSIRVDGLWC